MGINLTSNFSEQAAVPLDDRIVVANATERLAIPSGRRYAGMTVYQKDIETFYCLASNLITWRTTIKVLGAGFDASWAANTFSLSGNSSLATIMPVGSDVLGNARSLVLNSSAELYLKSGGSSLDHFIFCGTGFAYCPVTTAQKIAISSPPLGLTVFDTDLDAPCVYTSAGWKTYQLV